jgi:hypothetical protein
MVDLQVDASQARAGRRRDRARGRTSASRQPVDALVVVAEEEDSIGGRREAAGRALSCAGRRPGPRRQAALGSARASGRRATRRSTARRSPAGRGRRSRGPPVAATRARSPRTPRGRGPASGSSATWSAVTPSSSFNREIAVSSRIRSAASATGRTRRRTRRDRPRGSTAAPASRRISRPSAWKVRTATLPASTPSGSSAASNRSVISSAARLLKVIARMASGGVPLSISHAARATRVVVLPDPAGATHRSGPTAQWPRPAGPVRGARAWLRRRDAHGGWWRAGLHWRLFRCPGAPPTGPPRRNAQYLLPRR